MIARQLSWFDEPPTAPPALAAVAADQPAIPLRDYQREAVAAVDRHEVDGVKRQLVVLPTGCGKTIIFSEVARQRLDKPVLILAHRDELIRQAVDKFRMVAGNVPVGVVKAERDECEASVVVASVQTLAHRRRLARLAPRGFGLVVVDEAHHATSSSYRQILDGLGAFAAGGPLTLGVTATPDRGDGVGLGAVFERIVFEARLLDMIARGYLCDVRALRVHVGLDLSQVRTSHGDWQADELGAAMFEAQAHRAIAEAVAEHAADRRSLVFAPTVDLANSLAEALNDVGLPAAVVVGDTPAEERQRRYDQLDGGEIRALTSVGVLTEGFDLPSVDCIVMARPTRSRALYTQCVGRGLRIAPGKNDCLVIDVVGVAGEHRLQTAATLTGLPLGAPDELKGEAFPGRGEGLIRSGQRRSLLELLRAQGSIAENGKHVAVNVDLFDRSWARWLRIDDNRWALPAGEETLILIERDGAWQVVAKSKAAGVEVLHDRLDFGYAMGVAEARAKAAAGAIAGKDARWRQAPATLKQRETLNKFRVVYPDDITRGAASDLLTAAMAKRARVS